MDGQNYTLISSGEVPAFVERFEQRIMTFENTTPYRHYRLIFPTVVDTSPAHDFPANSMQIAEVQLFGTFEGSSGRVADAGRDYQEVSPRPGWQYLQSNAATGGVERALWTAQVGNAGNAGYGGGTNSPHLPAVLEPSPEPMPSRCLTMARPTGGCRGRTC